MPTLIHAQEECINRPPYNHFLLKLSATTQGNHSMQLEQPISIYNIHVIVNVSTTESVYSKPCTWLFSLTIHFHVYSSKSANQVEAICYMQCHICISSGLLLQLTENVYTSSVCCKLVQLARPSLLYILGAYTLQRERS